MLMSSIIAIISLIQLVLKTSFNSVYYTCFSVFLFSLVSYSLSYFYFLTFHSYKLIFVQMNIYSHTLLKYKGEKNRWSPFLFGSCTMIRKQSTVKEMCVEYSVLRWLIWRTLLSGKCGILTMQVGLMSMNLTDTWCLDKGRN